MPAHAQAPKRTAKPLHQPSSSRPAACAALSRREVVNAAVLASAVVTAAPTLQPRAAQAGYVDEETAEAVFRSAVASVAAIEDFRSDKQGVTQEGVGSGFVWDKYGHIVTNYHCVAKLARDETGQQSTKVTFYDDDGPGSSYTASVVGTDPSRDLAVLSIDAPAELLHPIKVGTSADLKIGQYLFAIGNPSGLSRTQTCGVVSGLNRAIASPSGSGARIPGAIQTDAPINAGNSGGPLLDSSGRLVGVNTATFAKQGTGRGSGVNFALPVDMVRRIVPQLIVYRDGQPRSAGRQKL